MDFPESRAVSHSSPSSHPCIVHAQSTHQNKRTRHEFEYPLFIIIRLKNTIKEWYRPMTEYSTPNVISSFRTFCGRCWNPFIEFLVKSRGHFQRRRRRRWDDDDRWRRKGRRRRCPKGKTRKEYEKQIHGSCCVWFLYYSVLVARIVSEWIPVTMDFPPIC